MDGLQHGDEYPWIIKGVSYNGNLKWVAMNAATGEESPEFGHYKTAQAWIRAERPGTLLRKSVPCQVNGHEFHAYKGAACVHCGKSATSTERALDFTGDKA